ncbi:hypothetical protein [Novosphingobium album (ex Hu et al. 2023)]|uniref:DUF2169 domain-containing protein n=1 Tax=Novosphingobium album (ex Hu et al. 2023) TaxID=2930093 RepID=A0ABT0B563_9SPHN|nr:hypothetical protein [Novosphingobium album (ex Hu et al. 2023)]MCJ2180175.1 hypothetical protein [Novosphingobium album (ex Hu et al. 2023)]
MADIRDLPVMTKADAVSIGFAGFNDVPHKPIDIPDGEFTITAKTSDGRRVTFCFLPGKDYGPAEFVDIQYHDAGTAIPNTDGEHSPTFNAFGIGRGGRHILDARSLPLEDRPSILVLMLDQPSDHDGPNRPNAHERPVGAMSHQTSSVLAECPTVAGSATPGAKPLWAAHFPDFPPAAMPPIPGNWIDKSWRNDAAPSFKVCTGPMGEPVEMWIDYLDPAMREIDGAPRFALYRRDTEDDLVPIYSGDDQAEAMEHANRETLACAFAKAVAQALTCGEWQAMRLANRTIMPGACASHDYIDANVVMHDVWLSSRGNTLIAQGKIRDIGDDLDHVNAAWSIAKAHYLTATSEGERFDAWRCGGRDIPHLLATGAGMEPGSQAVHRHRIYEPGSIDLDGNGRLIVTVGSDTRTFKTRIEAEGHLWRAYASFEFEHHGAAS